MFLVDWSDDDFGELDFYDMFDVFYPIVNGNSVPYVADDNLLIDDNSNTTNLCWSSRKLTQEFAKRPMVIIQDSEPTEISIGQIWISENPS